MMPRFGKRRYMIDRRPVYSRASSENGEVVGYEPIGVWVQGPGPNDIEIHYLPGIDETEQDSFWVINRLVENGIKTIPPDFLEYHRDTQPPYHGSRGPIVEVDLSKKDEVQDRIYHCICVSGTRVTAKHQESP